MKNLFTLLFVLILGTCADAQNLVPNYSFEEADSCPTHLDDLICIGCMNATLGKPDYFNICDTAATSIGRRFPWVGVPHNFIGCQTANEGLAYVGLNLFIKRYSDYKEYLGVAIQPLAIDTEYAVTIHISLADSCNYATDGFGVLFTTYGSPNNIIFGTLNKIPQIDYSSYGIISDTVNWTTLTSTFVADSAYNYLIIGGFKKPGIMKIEAVNDTSSNLHDNSYYYLDNIEVEKLSKTNISIINQKNNICLYPNPFNLETTLYINSQNSSIYKLKIYNYSGVLVREIVDISDNKVAINRGNLPSGIYSYNLIDLNNKVLRGTFAIY